MAELLEGLLPFGMRTDHPRFFAFIPSPASPLSWVGELVTAVHNAHAGSARQSEGACAIESALVSWLAAQAGLPEEAGGLFVSGGSMANLVGLAVARDSRLTPADRGRAVVYVSSQTHGSVAKGLRILGFLDRQIRVLPADASFRFDVAALAEAVAADRAEGRTPFAVAATAGATNSGAVDPLPAIADLCGRERLWMHVDGAYGASALLCAEARPLLAGIERADSLSWDAHKWLFQTYGCGLALVRDEALLAASFRTGEDYLRDGEGGAEPNFWDLGPELTRPARATKLWLTLQTMGLEAVDAAIAHGLRMAEAAERMVRGLPRWTVVSPARMAIVTFRCSPAGLADEAADEINAAAARRLTESGFAVVGTTRLQGRLVLRMCAVNPETSEADLEETLARLDAFAAEELDSRRPVVGRAAAE